MNDGLFAQNKINKLNNILSSDKKFKRYRRLHPKTVLEIKIGDRFNVPYGEEMLRSSIEAIAENMYALGYATACHVTGNKVRFIFIK